MARWRVILRVTWTEARCLACGDRFMALNDDGQIPQSVRTLVHACLPSNLDVTNLLEQQC
jgi:hypothetical protein